MKIAQGKGVFFSRLVVLTGRIAPFLLVSVYEYGEYEVRRDVEMKSYTFCWLSLH